MSNFKPKLTILIFLDHIYPKRMFPLWIRKREHHHWILLTWISLGAKFQLKLTLFETEIFGPNLLNERALYIFGILYAALASRTAEQIFPPKIRKLWKYYLFTDYIQKRHQKSENFEGIRKNMSVEKRQFQYVLLNVKSGLELVSLPHFLHNF